MEWSKKMKLIYAIAFGIIVILIAAYPIYKVTNPAKTCFDKKQNGNETGVDCGGSCVPSCLSEIRPLNVVWTKAFSLGGSSYDLGAYVENPNAKSGVESARYTLRAFDSTGKVLGEKSGVTEIAPGVGFVIFEPRVLINGNPDRVEIVFNQDDLSRWVKASVSTSIINSKNQSLKNVDTTPRFDATLVNTDLENQVKNLTVNAIIYDALRHPIAVSRTLVDSISMSGSQDIFFTWPNRFSKNTGGGICTTPVDTMLVLDRSGSMNVGGKLVGAKNAAISYIDSAEQIDKVGLISFATTVPNPIDHELSLDHDAVKKSTDAIQVEAGPLQYTNLGEALRAAVVELQGINHAADAKPVIVALTDGIANRPLDPADAKNKAYPEKYAILVAKAARSAGIDVYAIGLGEDINSAFLSNDIATDPSYYYKAPTVADLGGIYKKISETVCKQEGFITDIIITPRATFAQ